MASSHVSNPYSYSGRGHQNTEEAEPSAGMSPGVCSDPDRRQELSKAGN